MSRRPSQSTDLDHDEGHTMAFPCVLATTALPSPWPSPQGDRFCLSFRCCGSQASVHMGKRCRSLLLEAFSGQADCCLSLNISGFVPSHLLPWVNWALSQSLVAQAPFPQGVSTPVSMVRCDLLAQQFWNWFCPVSFFKALLEKLLLLIDLVEGQAHSWSLMVNSIWSVLYWLVLVIPGLERVTSVWITTILGLF